jgi:coenzyme F420-dependent glucose-6-phosphate dehydrogenase
MMPGRLFLGVGTGENLNEHIVRQGCPEVAMRQEQLMEAMAVIRLRWHSTQKSHHGKYFVVENARLYSLPQKPPPIMVAAAGPKSLEITLGLIGTEPDGKMLQQFTKNGGAEKPCYGEPRAVWPIAGLPSPLLQKLPLPSHFAKAAELVSEDDLAHSIPCGPDPEKHLHAIRKYREAGYKRICMHQIGPSQEPFMNFYAREIFPEIM